MHNLKFFGAAGMVTGSCHMIEDENGSKTLVDMGMFQGPSDIESLNNTLPDFNGHDVQNVILTHAHLDHCGRLPLLAKMGFNGNIYMTTATRDLTELVLRDAAKIAQEKEYVLYTDSEVEQILTYMKIVEYGQEFTVGKYKVIFYDAGHLLGSASALITDPATNQTIAFSGDLGNTPDPLLRPTENIESANTVVMESTYGDRNHPEDDGMSILQKEINLVENKGSVLLIPAFSLERTQMILYMIKNLKRKNKIKNQTPIFLDSPMGIRATKIYTEYENLFNDELINEFRLGDPFSFPNLMVTRSHKQSMRIEKQLGAKVIIAGSGMMNGGRIINHAKKYLSDEKNRLLIVGYQGEETLGREIKMGAKQVEIDGESVPVNAAISEINNMSAHADQKRLLSWVNTIKDVNKVVLIHGDDGGPRETLKQKISDSMGLSEIYMPHLNETVSL